ncbi:MAG: 16S rRNA (cytosine(1402)-N(4))-methyltransferase RsmH [Gemmatimonadota bacterium]
MSYHEPVLVDEVLEHLGPLHGGTVLDATVGGAGHAARILEHCPACDLLAVDRDPEALAAARARLAPFGERVRFVNARFDEALGVAEVAPGSLSGALLDLGVSSHQLDADRRGFTFRPGAPLGMQMEGEGPSAADLLNEASADELHRIFKDYGELPRARGLAAEIVRRRAAAPFAVSDDLVAALSRTLGRSASMGEKARAFQALRIALNAELEALESALPAIRAALAPGAVVVVIAYHSLEDRIVKRAFQEWSRSCVCPPRLPVCVCRGRPLGETLTRSPVTASAEEAERNPRARSAKLRAWRAAA